MLRTLMQFFFFAVVFSGSAFQVRSQQTATDQKQREVMIYFWDANSKKSDLGLSPVKRMVLAAAPLRPALEALFGGPTKEEEARGLSSSTFGMRFEGVTLTNGVTLVKFSQPVNETNYGSQGPMIFAEAIEKTARQFSTVKKVEICAVGETLIDSQLEKPFPRCPK
jgi:spore germination protein GerM